ncbi:MAG: hypothetical protein ACI8XB_003345 [Patiriisocius sp.]|jgi:hypothetical protein
MTTLKKFLFLALVASLSIVSCSKDEDNDDDNHMEETMSDDGAIVNPEDYPELLTGNASRSWRANTFTLMGFSQDCRLDDTFTFNMDNTYSYNGGDELCGDEDDTINKNGTWTLDENSENIIFDQGTDNEFTAVISTAKEHEIVLTGSYLLMPISGSYSY